VPGNGAVVGTPAHQPPVAHRAFLVGTRPVRVEVERPCLSHDAQLVRAGGKPAVGSVCGLHESVFGGIHPAPTTDAVADRSERAHDGRGRVDADVAGTERVGHAREGRRQRLTR
jgi:hypothetical protein